MRKDDVESQPEKQIAGEPRPKGRLAEGADVARPWLDRALLNLRVWLPALRTPDMKARLVKYRSSDARSGLTWTIALPQQCYACGKTENLTHRKFSQGIRAFDSPTTILGGTIGFAGLLLVIGLATFWTTPFILAFLLLLMGSVYQFIKSWKERVKLSIFSCAEHLDDLAAPEVVSHDEDLYVFLPHESLSEPARAELIASRKQSQKSRPPLMPQSASRSESEPSPADDGGPPPSLPSGRRAELPPLKLAGDEDE